MHRQKTNHKSTWIFLFTFLLVIFSSCVVAEETASDLGLITEETETDQKEMHSATEPSHTAQTTTVPVTTSPTTTVSTKTSTPITIAPPTTTSAPVTTESVTTTPVTTVPITTEPVTTAPATKAPETTTTVTHDYVLNTNSEKFHEPTCSSVDKMSDKNKKFYTGTRSDLIAEGYNPCHVCNP